jgi:cell division protein FtsI (penicillin-binding protein 3)
MALQAGFNEQYNFFKKAKFLERLKTEVVEMERPIIPKYDSWKRSDSAVATLGYGYSISLSPLHLVAAYSAVVNGGIYHNPTFLARSNPEAEGERILSDNTSKQMRQLVRAVVTKGSGRNANVAGYEVGGKTGTANKLGPKGEYMDNAVRATFMSAFPISNPQYALLVMLDEPKMFNNNRNTRNAGWNAVPTSAQIISAVAPQLNVPANYDIDDKRNAKIIEASFER